MKWLNYWIRVSLGFSGSEANGMMILIPLVLIIVASPFLYKHFIYSPPPNPFDYDEMENMMAILEQNMEKDSVQRAEKWNKIFNNNYYSNRLGNSHKQGKRKFETTGRTSFFNRFELSPININTADTTDLKKIRGIGSVLSSRILKYRDILGGFTSKNQLREVYGLRDSVLIGLDSMIYITQDYQPKELDLNSMSESELKRHPYISYNIAKAIDAYKFQHGPVTSIDDLKKIKLMDSLTLQKLLPYLKLKVVKD